MKGEELIRTLISNTGLPESDVSTELDQLISRSGHSPDQITLDQMREILAEYLQDLILDLNN